MINKEQLKMVKDYLDKNQVPYDMIVPKMVAEVYIDDRACLVDPNRGISWEQAMNSQHFKELIAGE
jgi:hypothetical protein